MVSTSMPRCACRCYDNECILKTNTSRWHIADKPTPNVSQPTCGYCGYRYSAYRPGWWHYSAELTGPGSGRWAPVPDPLSGAGRPSLCVGWVWWPIGVGAMWISHSPAAPCHLLAMCNANVGSDTARHCWCLPSAGSQAWAPVLIREDGCCSPQTAEVLLESLCGRGSLW